MSVPPFEVSGRRRASRPPVNSLTQMVPISTSSWKSDPIGVGGRRIRGKTMNYKHGHAAGGSVTTTYRIWENMLHRCRHDPEYHGRGISFDPRWANFQAFLVDMGERPEGLTLDRIDNDGPYCKTNCRWTTYSEQNRNQRPRRERTKRHGNARLTEAEVLSIRSDLRSGAEIGADFGISRSMANRIKRGAAHSYLTARRHVVR